MLFAFGHNSAASAMLRRRANRVRHIFATSAENRLHLWKAQVGGLFNLDTGRTPRAKFSHK
jgi:hypothetical protein